MKNIYHGYFQHNFSSNGFTFVELIVFVAVLGFLGAIAIPMYNGYVSDAKKKSAKAVLE